MFRSPFAGSMVVLLLLMTVTLGLNAGITADSKAEIHTQFDEARNINFEEAEKAQNPAVPDEYEQRLEAFENAIPSPTPDSFDRAVERRVQSFVKVLTVQLFNIAEGIAIFAFNHQAIIGHPAVVVLTEAIVSLAILAVLAWNMLRGFRVYRGVDR